MEPYKLIEQVSLNQIDKLPVTYKKMGNSIDINLPISIVSDSIFVKSTRHQTSFFGGIRFYKNIEIFLI
jgi:hypothetical protein